MAHITKVPKKLKFTLRFPSELRTASFRIALSWFTNKLYPILDFGGPRKAKFPDGGVPPGYLREGFLSIQHAISKAFISLSAPETKLPVVVMQRYPYPAYIYDPILRGLITLTPFLILISYIYPCTHIVKYITAEKEKQLKEIMKIMGLSNWLHWIAWFVKAFCMLTFSGIIIAIMFKVRLKFRYLID